MLVPFGGHGDLGILSFSMYSFRTGAIALFRIVNKGLPQGRGRRTQNQIPDSIISVERGFHLKGQVKAELPILVVEVD